MGPGLGAPKLKAAPQPALCPWHPGLAGAEVQGPPAPTPACQSALRRAPARDSAERALRVSADQGTADPAARGREARGSSGPGTGSPGGALPGSARAWPCTCTPGAHRRIGRAACGGPPEDGRGSLTGLRRFSVTFFQSSSCSWCRKPMAGPRSAASAPRPAPLHAPPGPAARRAARHRPRGGGALESPGPAPRRLRPGGRSYRDSRSRPRPPPPLQGVSALACPPGGARAPAAPAHSARPLCSTGPPGGNAVLPRSAPELGSRCTPFRGLGRTWAPYTSPRGLQICAPNWEICAEEYPRCSTVPLGTLKEAWSPSGHH